MPRSPPAGKPPPRVPREVHDNGARPRASSASDPASQEAALALIRQRKSSKAGAAGGTALMNIATQHGLFRLSLVSVHALPLLKPQGPKHSQKDCG